MIRRATVVAPGTDELRLQSVIRLLRTRQHRQTITVGAAFVPIHWNGQTASDARVGAVVNPEVDPVSGETRKTKGVLTIRSASVYTFEEFESKTGEEWAKELAIVYTRFEQG